MAQGVEHGRKDEGRRPVGRLSPGHSWAYLLPRARAVGLLAAVHSGLVLPEVDQGGSQAGKVRDTAEQQLGGPVHPLLVTAVSNLQQSGSCAETFLSGKIPQGCSS